MSNILWRNCGYFQLPKAIVENGLTKSMSESALKLYVGLLYKAQRATKVELALTKDELGYLVTLSANSLTKARRQLGKLGLVQSRREQKGTYVYTLCNPETGQPLIRHKRKARAAKRARLPGEKLQTMQRSNGKQIKDLAPEQFERYFKARLEGQDFAPSGKGVATRCPFHTDTKPSMSLDFQHGRWYCHACKMGGGVIAFEKRLSGCNKGTAFRNMAEIVGDPELLQSATAADPEAVYSYRDEQGKVLNQVLRYPGKVFSQRRPGPNGEGWIYDLKGVRWVLYRLPEVIAADVVIVVEGEKDADRVTSLGLVDVAGKVVAATTAPGGAKKWQDDYSAVLTGKKVLVIPDTDEAGLEHGDLVFESAAQCADDARLAFLPLDFKDVSDYLNEHKKEDLLALMRKETGEGWFLRVGIA